MSIEVLAGSVVVLGGARVCVLGTITTSAGEADVDNTGFVVPTLVTETGQGGAQLRLGICAGGGAQTIPAGSIVTYSVIAP